MPTVTAAGRATPHIFAPRVDCPDFPGGPFNFLDFANTSNLCLNGSAAPFSRNGTTVLRLTPDNPHALNGEAWYDGKIYVRGGFSTTFTFQITTGATSPNADGLAFVIQNSSLSAQGTGGCGIGYNGIPNSLAVEFDTFNDSPQGPGAFCADYQDPNSDHVAIQSLGTQPNTASHSVGATLGINSALTDPQGGVITLADGNPHQATLTYVSADVDGQGTLTLTLDGVVQLSRHVDLTQLLALDNGQAWVGLTAGTGADTEIHDILS